MVHGAAPHSHRQHTHTSVSSTAHALLTAQFGATFLLEKLASLCCLEELRDFPFALMGDHQEPVSLGDPASVWCPGTVGGNYRHLTSVLC